MSRNANSIHRLSSVVHHGDDRATNIGDNLDRTLKIENILLEEFGYASTTVYQAMEDRARMLNLYLLLVGIVGSALGVVYQLGGSVSSYSQLLATFLLLIAGMVGTAFFVKLIRLRQAWRESVICMNVIKEFYIQQFRQQMPRVDHVFHWRLKTIPAGERPGSITFIICSTIAFLEGLCFAGAGFITAKGVPFLSGSVYPYVIATVVFVSVLLLSIVYYRHSLNLHQELAVIEEQAREIDDGDKFSSGCSTTVDNGSH